MAKSGAAGYQSQYLSHAKRVLYHLSYRGKKWQKVELLGIDPSTSRMLSERLPPELQSPPMLVSGKSQPSQEPQCTNPMEIIELKQYNILSKIIQQFTNHMTLSLHLLFQHTEGYIKSKREKMENLAMMMLCTDFIQ